MDLSAGGESGGAGGIGGALSRRLRLCISRLGSRETTRVRVSATYFRARSLRILRRDQGRACWSWRTSFWERRPPGVEVITQACLLCHSTVKEKARDYWRNSLQEKGRTLRVGKWRFVNRG